MSTINIKIHETETAWEIWETTAPVDYDGFGTFTIHNYNGARTVLIRCEHWDWQTSRYTSGNHVHKPSPLPTEEVARYLWNRLLGRNP